MIIKTTIFNVVVFFYVQSKLDDYKSAVEVLIYTELTL
jgi:hypothetical protein